MLLYICAHIHTFMFPNLLKHNIQIQILRFNVKLILLLSLAVDNYNWRKFSYVINCFKMPIYVLKEWNAAYKSMWTYN